MDENQVRERAEEDFDKTWKPLLFTKGKLDIEKIKNEMLDLIFIYEQVGIVYCELTGNALSKPTYYAKTIIDFHNEECQKSFDEGYDCAKKDFNIKE